MAAMVGRGVPPSRKPYECRREPDRPINYKIKARVPVLELPSTDTHSPLL